MYSLLVAKKGQSYVAGYDVASIEDAYKLAEERFAYSNVCLWVTDSIGNVIIPKQRFKRVLTRRKPETRYTEIVL